MKQIFMVMLTEWNLNVEKLAFDEWSHLMLDLHLMMEMDVATFVERVTKFEMFARWKQFH